MDLNQVTTNARAHEWAERESANGWHWYAGDERTKAYLWNPHTDVRNSIDAMLLKAIQEGIDRSAVLPALYRELRTIDGVKFAPGKPQYLLENGCAFYNTWRSMADAAKSVAGIEPIPDCEIQPFLDFISRITANDEDREWIMCWMAHMIQKPEERPSVHPLFRSQHGIGKNVLVESVLHRLLAGHTSTNSLRQITSEHSESVGNNILVFVDESKSKGLNVYLQLKSILSSRFATISPKYVREYQQEIYARFMFADNTEGRAFNIEQDDRRIYVMEYIVHEIDKEETQEFIQEFLYWWQGGWFPVYQYLNQYDISNWSPFNCPMTKAKQDYLGMCSDQLEGLITQYISDTNRLTITENSWNHFVGEQDFSYEESESYQWTILHTNKELYFRQKLEDVGFREKNTSKRVEGVQYRKKAWILSNHGHRSEFDLVAQEEERNRRPNTDNYRTQEPEPDTFTI